MKKIIYAIIALMFLVSCNSEEVATFDIMPDASVFTFTPVPGGAIMEYDLPEEIDIFSIKAKYKDPRGNDVVVIGSYAANSMNLVGFDYAEESVEVELSFLDRDDVESNSIKATFSTKDSGPVSLLKSAKVEGGWSGFQVAYTLPVGAKGVVHIFYDGFNPNTNMSGLVPVDSYPFQGTGDEVIKSYPLVNGSDYNDVIIRVEDLRGYIVDEVVYEKVASLSSEIYANADQIKFHDPMNKCIYDEEGELSWKYLFDGDKKGDQVYGFPWSDPRMFTFLAGPDAVGVPFIFEFPEAQVIAAVKIYAMLHSRYGLPDPDDTYSGRLWAGWYHNKLPAGITVYASNDKDDNSSWVTLGTYYEDPTNLDMRTRWADRALRVQNIYASQLSPEDYEKADPEFIRLDFPATEQTYKYMKIVVDALFEKSTSEWFGPNTSNLVTFHEIETYVKK